jgi:hypothetical protein
MVEMGTRLVVVPAHLVPQAEQVLAQLELARPWQVVQVPQGVMQALMASNLCLHRSAQATRERRAPLDRLMQA